MKVQKYKYSTQSADVQRNHFELLIKTRLNLFLINKVSAGIEPCPVKFSLGTDSK